MKFGLGLQRGIQSGAHWVLCVGSIYDGDTVVTVCTAPPVPDGQGGLLGYVPHLLVCEAVSGVVR